MKALALVDAPDHVCCRTASGRSSRPWREPGWSLTLEGLARGAFGRGRNSARAARFDVVILQRKLLPGWQLRELRRPARRLVFDFDDAVLYRDSYDPRGPHCRRRARRSRGRSGGPTWSSPATTSWPIVPSRPGRGPSGST